MNFCKDATILLHEESACYTRRFAENSSSCVASFWNQAKNVQRVAERDIAREIVLDNMLHGIDF